MALYTKEPSPNGLDARATSQKYSGGFSIDFAVKMRHDPFARLEHLTRHRRVTQLVEIPKIAGAHLEEKQKKHAQSNMSA